MKQKASAVWQGSLNVRDPFGHEWTISQQVEKVSSAEMQRRRDEMIATAET